MNQDILQKFYDSKNRNIIVHNKFIYNDKTNLWEPETEIPIQGNKNSQANLVDNNNEFNVINPIVLDKKLIPIYKEISYFNINGLEKYKVSKLNTKLTDVSKTQNTYLKAETFFNEIIKLKKDDIYVSEVIGEYVPSKVIGTFTKEKASQITEATKEKAADATQKAEDAAKATEQSLKNTKEDAKNLLNSYKN